MTYRFAEGLAVLMPRIAQEKKAEKQARLRPGKLVKVCSGRYVGFVDDNLFIIQQLASDFENAELLEFEGSGRWSMWGTLPITSAKYRFRFKTLNECRSILAGMQIQFNQSPWTIGVPSKTGAYWLFDFKTERVELVQYSAEHDDIMNENGLYSDMNDLRRDRDTFAYILIEKPEPPL